MGHDLLIIAYTPKGTRLGEDLAKRVGAAFYGPQQLLQRAVDSHSGTSLPRYAVVQQLCVSGQSLVCIMDMESAVRMIAPAIAERDTLAEVVVIDEDGKYVIPLLSGRENRAGQLAQQLAEHLGAEAVFTAAMNEPEQHLSIADVAQTYQLAIENRELLPKFEDAIIRKKSFLVWDRSGLDIVWPENIRVNTEEKLQCTPDERLLLVVGFQTLTMALPLQIQVMSLRPICLRVGVSCGGDVSPWKVVGAIRRYFREWGWAVKSIKQLVAVDGWVNPDGVRHAARDLGVGLTLFSKTDFESLKLKWGFHEPPNHWGEEAWVERMVMQTVPPGKLIGMRRCIERVTIAVALIDG